MPTPGAAPRGRMAREPQEACRGPTARAAPDARSGHPGPPRRLRRRPRRGACRARADPARRGPCRHRRSRPAAPRLDRRDQPDGHPRAGRGGRRARHRQPDRARGPARGRRRPVHRPRVGRRLPGPAAGRRLSGRARPAPRARRQEGALPVDRHRGHRPRRRRSRPPPVRAEALAADRRHRGRWPAVTARAVAPLPELVELAVPLLAPGRPPDRLEARRHRGRAGRRGTGDRRARRRVDRAPRPCPPRASTDTASWSSPRAAACRPPIRATPARGDAGRGDGRAARFVPVRIAVLSDIHSNLVALDAVLAKIGSVDAIWHLGDVVGYGARAR